MRISFEATTLACDWLANVAMNPEVRPLSFRGVHQYEQTYATAVRCSSGLARVKQVGGPGFTMVKDRH